MQHTPQPQLPPAHLVPLAAWVTPHLPSLHEATKQLLPPDEQALHAMPLAPHLLVLPPEWQLTPSQQPVQQAPLRQTPPLHLVPSLEAALVHLPALQEPLEQGFLVLEQSTQLLPAAPQAVLKVPARHWVPWQQPRQLLVLQVPPQPSLAPAHLPLQSGSHTQLPLTHWVPLLQVPQVPPQPSLPQVLELQSGVQPLQAPDTQLLLWLVQSTQAVPAVPHCASSLPARQAEASQLQQPLQTVASQTQTPSLQRVPVGQLWQPLWSGLSVPSPSWPLAAGRST